MEVQNERAVALLRLDAYRVGFVDQLAREIREQLGHYLPIPLILIRRATGSVGCAPLLSQSFTFASSSSISDGSDCGL